MATIADQPLDISAALRTAIIGNGAITAFLSTWTNEPAVFTMHPTPEDATYPLISIGPDVSIADMDYLVSRLPMVRRDLFVYGALPDDHRNVEGIGYLLRQQFHRQRFSIDLSDQGYGVIDIVARGPVAAPVDDSRLIGRAVLLMLRLKDLAT